MADTVQIGQIVAGKYSVERILAEGGMGLLVAARHVHLGELVALKFMLSKALVFDNAVERFMREAQAVARLRGENIARVMDVGVMPDGMPYIVMEYLQGLDFASLVTQRGPLAVEDAVDYLLQACTGMAEAHDHGIVHRDLKPANLFLTRRPSGAPLVKVLDFGLSKYEPADGGARSFTTTVGTMGSPPYMSPEQARSAKTVDHRSDIWSLGVILYYFTTGRQPFTAETNPEILVKVMRDPPPSLRDWSPWVPPGFESVVMRCLAKDPDQRFQHVTELAAALTPYASAEGRSLVSASRVPVSGPVVKLHPDELEAADSPVPGPAKLDFNALPSGFPSAHVLQLGAGPPRAPGTPDDRTAGPPGSIDRTAGPPGSIDRTAGPPGSIDRFAATAYVKPMPSRRGRRRFAIIGATTALTLAVGAALFFLASAGSNTEAGSSSPTLTVTTPGQRGDADETAAQPGDTEVEVEVESNSSANAEADDPARTDGDADRSADDSRSSDADADDADDADTARARSDPRARRRGKKRRSTDRRGSDGTAQTTETANPSGAARERIKVPRGEFDEFQAPQGAFDGIE